MIDDIGEDYFVNSKNEYGKEIFALVKETREMFEQTEYPVGEINFSSFIDLAEYAKGSGNEPWPTQSVDGEYFSGFDYTVRYLLSEHYLCDALQRVIDEKGADPYGFGKNLNAAQKAYLKESIEASIDDVLENTKKRMLLTSNIEQNTGSNILREDILINGGSLGYTTIIDFNGDTSIIYDDNGNGNKYETIIPNGELTKEQEESLKLLEERYEKAGKTILQLFGVK